MLTITLLYRQLDGHIACVNLVQFVDVDRLELSEEILEVSPQQQNSSK